MLLQIYWKNQRFNRMVLLFFPGKNLIILSLDFVYVSITRQREILKLDLCMVQRLKEKSKCPKKEWNSNFQSSLKVVDFEFGELAAFYTFWVSFSFLSKHTSLKGTIKQARLSPGIIKWEANLADGRSQTLQCSSEYTAVVWHCMVQNHLALWGMKCRNYSTSYFRGWSSTVLLQSGNTP